MPNEILWVCTCSCLGFCIYPTDKFKPLFYPIKGVYNDYGGIEQYGTEITDVISKIIGVDFEEFLSAIDSDCANLSLNKLKIAEQTDNKFIKKSIEIYKKGLINIIEHLKKSNDFYEKFCDLDNFSISYTMERYDVYQKMASLFKGEKDNSKDIYDRVIDLRNEYNIKGSIYCHYQPFKTFSEKTKEFLEKGENISVEEANLLNKDIKVELEYSKLIRISTLFFIGESNGIGDGYGDVKIDEMAIKDKIYEFMLFNYSLTMLNGCYGISPTASQDIASLANKMIELNDFYKEKLIEIKKEDEGEE